jgi:hypothetical protein
MDEQTRGILTTELWRSVAWAGLGLVGWAFVIGESALEATTLTTLGLPFLTWALLTGGAVGLRLRTSRKLRLRSKTGLTLGFVLALVVGGFGAVYTVAVIGRSALLVGSLYLAVTAGTALWLGFVALGREEANATV